MSTNKNPQEDDALHNVLRHWTVDAPLPPRFQEQVWQRIAKAETPGPAIRTGFWRLLEVVLQRPKFAYAYLAVLLFAGVAGGSWVAQIKTTHLDSELSLRYVQSIDPYRGNTIQP